MNKIIIYTANKKLITFTIAGLTLTLIMFDISNNYINQLNEEFKQDKISLSIENKSIIKNNNYIIGKSYLLKENNLKFLENNKIEFSNKEGIILKGEYKLIFNTLFLTIYKNKMESFDIVIKNINIKENEIIGMINKEKFKLKLK